MMYCRKCGRRLNDSDRFCTGCGEIVSNNAGGKEGASSAHGMPNPNGAAFNQPPSEPQIVDHKSLQYVFVDKKTGKITHNPRVKTGSEGCLQFFGVALAAVAIVIGMVVGAVSLSIYFEQTSRSSGDYEMWESVPEPEVSSWYEVSSVASEDRPVSSEPVSSEEVSSEPAFPEELLAANMQKRIKGRWRTEIPYKSMNLPATFEFDSKGKCKCTIKALLFSKKFDGEYVIKDGGKCELTLKGLNDYLENDTMAGDLRFMTDDKMEFTVGNTIWKLNRVE